MGGGGSSECVPSGGVGVELDECCECAGRACFMGESGHDMHRVCCVVVVDLQVLQKEAAV